MVALHRKRFVGSYSSFSAVKATPLFGPVGRVLNSVGGVVAGEVEIEAAAVGLECGEERPNPTSDDSYVYAGFE
jgi:hypothetical protein